MQESLFCSFGEDAGFGFPEEEAECGEIQHKLEDKQVSVACAKGNSVSYA